MKEESKISESQAAEIFKLIANKLGYSHAILSKFGSLGNTSYYKVMLCSGGDPSKDAWLYQSSNHKLMEFTMGISWSSCLSELLNNSDTCFDSKFMHSIRLPKTYEELLVAIDIN